jgi:DNA-binding GntR family transcriptional regulator
MSLSYTADLMTSKRPGITEAQAGWNVAPSADRERRPLQAAARIVIIPPGKRLDKVCPYEALKALLVCCHFAPGAQLEIAALAKRFSSSSTPVREALHRLCTEGFLDLRPGRGFFAKALTLREMTELHEFGHLLLRHAVARCADARRGGGAVEAMQELARASATGVEDADALANRAERLLAGLVALLDNVPIGMAFRNFQERTHYLRKLALQDPARRKEYLDGLHALVEELRSPDARAALATCDARRHWKLQHLPDLIKDAVSQRYV